MNERAELPTTKSLALSWVASWKEPQQLCGQCERLCPSPPPRARSQTMEDLSLEAKRNRREWEDTSRWLWGVCVEKRRFFCSPLCAEMHGSSVVLVNSNGVALTECRADHSLPLAYRLWTLEHRRALYERCRDHCSAMLEPWVVRHNPFHPCHPTLFPELVKGCCLVQTLRNVASAWSESDWEVFPGKLGYRDFHHKVSHLAMALLSSGLPPGTLLRLRWTSERNRDPNVFISYFATLMAGMGAMIVTDDRIDMEGSVEFPSELPPCGDSSCFSRHSCPDADSPCLILSTSGSTGLARTVPLSFHQVHAQMLTAIAGGKAGRTVFVTLTDFRNSIFALAGGVSASLSSPDTWASDVASACITYLVTTPALLELLDDPGPQCKEITVGGAALPAPLLKRFIRKGRKISVLYGTTETGVIARNNVIISGVEWEIRSEMGGVGQLWVLKNGRWIDTGDLVERIGPRKIRVVGRHHASFKTSAGSFFNPEPLESFLESRYSHAIRRVFVFDGFLGVIFMVPGTDGALVGNLLEDARPWLPPYRIRFFLTHEDPPINLTGKVNRNVVYTHYQQHLVALANDHEDDQPRMSTEDAVFFGYDRDLPLAGQVNSIAVAKLVRRIHDATGITTNASWLLSGLTPSQIEDFLRRELANPTGERFVRFQDPPRVEDEVRALLEILKQDEAMSPVPTGAMMDSVFVTGCSGFLGRHVVEALCARHPRVVALVRNTVPYLPQSVTQVVGDLTLPYFGMEKQKWMSLALSVRYICHCAAQVDALLPYDALRGPNVVGTMEVLRLRQISGAVLVHISSAAVFNAYQAPANGFPSEFKLDASPSMAWMSGYSQTKWMAEHLVRRGAPSDNFVILRPGMIGPSGSDGNFNPLDFDARFSLTCIALGVGPDVHGPLAASPVDAVAALACACLTDPSKLGSALNVQCPCVEDDDDVGTLVGALNLPRLVPYQDWLSLVKANPQLPLAPLLDMFPTTVFPFRSGASMQSAVANIPKVNWTLFANRLLRRDFE